MGNYESRFYCGNNALNRTGKPRGSRYRCMRTGIGKGRSLPYDPQYVGGYQPIDNSVRLYCGDRHNTLAAANANLGAGRLPYTLLGTSPMCLQRGVGIGKAIRAREGRGYMRIIIFIMIWIVLTTATALSLYYTRPYFVLRDTGTGQIVDGGLLSLYTSIVSVLAGVILFIIYRVF